MVILIASEKGGSGKTTISITLAAMLAGYGRDVLLLDTDTQASASEWGRLRDNAAAFPRVTVLQKTGAVNKEVAKLVDKYDDIVIDAGGRDSEEMRSALLVAHVWYIPVRASQFDVWTIGKAVNLFESASLYNKELQAKVIVNGASTHMAHNDLDSVTDVVRDITDLFEVSSCVFSERNSFKKAAALGCCVTELTGKSYDKKAAAEAEALYMEIVNNG